MKDLINMSDSEILEIAQPIINDIINGSNQKNWALFSKYQPDEVANDTQNRQSVEKQWQKVEFLTSLEKDREILGVLKRENIIQIVWKQRSSKVEGDFLARLFLKEINKKIKEVGFIIQ